MAAARTAGSARRFWGETADPRDARPATRASIRAPRESGRRFVLDEDHGRALSENEPGAPFRARGAHMLVRAVVDEVPFVGRAHEEGVGTSVRKEHPGIEERVQRGRILLGDRDVRALDADLDRGLRGRRVRHRVRKEERRRRVGRFDRHLPFELGERTDAGRAGAEEDAGSLLASRDRIARVGQHLLHRDDGVLAAAIEAAGLALRQLRLRREGADARGGGTVGGGRPAVVLDGRHGGAPGGERGARFGERPAERGHRGLPGDDGRAHRGDRTRAGGLRFDVDTASLPRHGAPI